MMEAARTSETSVDNYFIRQYIAEEKSELHNRRRENLKSHDFHDVWYKCFISVLCSATSAPLQRLPWSCDHTTAKWRLAMPGLR
jgi:hypothetical protein